MAGQSCERPLTAEIGAELISLMLPDADLALVQLCSVAPPAARQMTVPITRATGAGTADPGPHSPGSTWH